MGADNWAVCPKCKETAEANFEKEKAKVAKSYGKVPAEKYLELLEGVKSPPEAEDTLREDYHLGVDSTGEFEVSYHCGCQTCGFKFSYKHTEKATP